MFTKQHYERIASILKEALPPEGSQTNNSIQARSTVNFIAENLAIAFSSDNPRFDEERFLKACGLES